MRLDRHTMRAVLLTCWCAFLTWLWASGETLRYLGTRTQWLVPFGAVAMAVAACASIQAARHDPRPSRLSPADSMAFLALLLPMATAMLLAHSQLGAQAASKKLTSRGIDPSALADLASAKAGELSFLQLEVAQKDREFAAEHGIRAGRPVRLLGFVSRTSKSAGTPFEVSRFYITCCVADSIPIGVEVLPPPRASSEAGRDTWLDVRGELVRGAGGRLLVQATRVREVKPPKHPYLSFAT